MRVDAVQHGEFLRLALQHRHVLAVEIGDLFGRQRRAHAAAGADAPGPAFARKGYLLVIGEKPAQPE